MRWLPSVKALVQNVEIGHAYEYADRPSIRDNRIQIALTTAIPVGGQGAFLMSTSRGSSPSTAPTPN